MNKSKTIEFPFPGLKFIKSEDFKNLGYSYYMINRMILTHMIKKINGNTYENLNYTGDESDYLYVSGYINQGIVCLMSAAVYHGLSTARMSHVDVAIKRKLKVNILPDWPTMKIYYFSNERYELGIENLSIEGGQLMIYDQEKTVCDVLFYREKYGIEDSIAVLKNYLKREDRNINKLIFYAKRLRCYNILSKYLEVLL